MDLAPVGSQWQWLPVYDQHEMEYTNVLVRMRGELKAQMPHPSLVGKGLQWLLEEEELYISVSCTC